jgi:D-amino-acid dehydrogenase
MARQAVVVGGGAIGISCAHFLQRSGFDITVVERDRVGRGCSHANCGLIVPSHSQPLPGPGIVREGLGHLIRRDSPFAIRPRPQLLPWLVLFWRACSPEAYRRGSEALVALSRASLELFEELDGTAEFGFRRGPLLHAYLSKEGLERAQAEVDLLEALGIRAREVSTDELLEMEPALSSDVLGGTVIEHQAWADPFAFVEGLAALVRRDGGRILERTTARQLLTRHGRARGIATGGSDERIEADLVVLAVGAWTPSLAAPLGLRIPIQPATGYSCTIAAPPHGPALPIVLPERRVVLTPLGSRLRFGGTLELSGFRTDPDQARYQAMVRAGLEALRPGLRVDAEDAWLGYRPLTADGLPVIGWAPRIEGAMVATGHGMLGFTQAPITGKVVADLAAGRPPSIPLEPFLPDRFARRRHVGGRSSSPTH